MVHGVAGSRTRLSRSTHATYVRMLNSLQAGRESEEEMFLKEGTQNSLPT